MEINFTASQKFYMTCVKRPISFFGASASGNKLPSASRSSVIVLNFRALKIFSFFPGRFWVKKTPAPLFAKCNKITVVINIGDNKISPIKAPKKLIGLFTHVI